MRSILVLMVALLLSLGPSRATAQSVGVGGGNSPAKHAVLFNVDGVTAGPSVFDGVGIGYRMVMSPKVFLRASLGFSDTTTDVKLDGTTATNELSTFNMEGGLEFILAQKGDLMLCGGAMLVAGKSTDDKAGDQNTIEDSHLGLEALLNVTWFLTDQVSLGAEYRAGLVSRASKLYSDGTETDATTLETNASGFQLGFWF